MRFPRAILGLAVVATTATLALAQATKPSPSQPINGTIKASNSIIEASFGASSAPMKWHGITFTLQEFPGREFIFNSQSFEHQGRNLATDNLKGVKVQVTCKNSGQRTCRVATLKWLDAPSPAQGK